MLHLQPRGNSNARAFPIRNGVHDLAPTIRAIPARKKLRVGSLACGAIN
jgi:hypothetical protein